MPTLVIAIACAVAQFYGSKKNIMNTNKIGLMMIAWMATLGAISCSRNNDTANAIEKLPGTVVLEWNETAFKAFDGPVYQHSLMASRINAMTHLAMHDALNAIHSKYATYAFKNKDAGPLLLLQPVRHTRLCYMKFLRRKTSWIQHYNYHWYQSLKVMQRVAVSSWVNRPHSLL